MEATQQRRRLSTVSAVSAAVLVVMLGLTGLAFWVTHTVVRDQEHRLLDERTSEVRLVLTSAVSSLTATMPTLDAELRPSGDTTATLAEITAPEVAGNTAVGFAVLRPVAGGYQVGTATGHGLTNGQILAGPRAATAEAATNAKGLLATPIVGTGAARVVGFAIDASSLPDGSILYEQLELGPVAAPKAAATAPFHELQVAIYASRRAMPTQVLATTTRELPLPGSVDYQLVPVGGTSWLLGVSTMSPLVGTVAADAQWLILAVGVLVSVLVALVIQSETRRRQAAMARYTSEHEVAATLQRSLLPALPELGGLDLAARYLVGGRGQEVGGDWFDVFDIDGDRVGMVIGDVIGHDVAAAAAMSQIRAALRAYAWEGAEPATVLERLDHLVQAFGLAELVTVFYGVLHPPGTDGSRVLRYANAGHLPPLVKLPDRQVRSLTEGRSIIVGAPTAQARAQAEERLLPGSTLLLFTDGLVEVPGGSLEDSLAELVATVTREQSTEAAEILCEHVIAAMPAGQSYDDIAILAVRLLDPEQAGAGPPAAGDKLVTAR